ncbi:unnamed protein product [Closterium sp. NIES-65]|nr:unnamed protein product [Closterium sp. NIES-65]
MSCFSCLPALLPTCAVPLPWRPCIHGPRFGHGAWATQMVPWVDVTVEGIHLTLHGRPHALNAVVLTSVAASSFNSHLALWEPLLEPFDSIFKYPHTAPPLPPLLFCCSTATNLAALSSFLPHLFAMPFLSHRMQHACQGASPAAASPAAAAAAEGEGGGKEGGEEGGVAVDREDALRVLVDNRLGAPLYARSAKDAFAHLYTLPPAHTSSVPLPPFQFPDMLRPSAVAGVGGKRRHSTRRFMALRLIEGLVRHTGRRARGAGGAGPTGQRVERGGLHLQAARGAGGRPAAGQGAAAAADCPLARHPPRRGLACPHAREGMGCAMPRGGAQGGAGEGGEGGRAKLWRVQWNEVFVFEVPAQVVSLCVRASLHCTHVLHWWEQKESRLEVVVSNQAANAGRGATVGTAAVPMTAAAAPTLSDWAAVTDALGIGGLHPASQATQHTLRPSAGPPAAAREALAEAGQEQPDCLIQLACRPDGEWCWVRSMAGIMTLALALEGRPVAAELGVRGGLKCVTLRSLVLLRNATDAPVDVCVCPFVLLDFADEDAEEEVEEEMYENQRYQPMLGWGSLWPGHFMPGDPARFSALDLSHACQDLPEACPRGWAWVGAWHRDQAAPGDMEGWLYAPDFRSLASPDALANVAHSKGPFDFVRRRRFTRTRRRLPRPSGAPKEHVRTALGRWLPVTPSRCPWGCLSPGSDWCLQRWGGQCGGGQQGGGSAAAAAGDSVCAAGPNAGGVVGEGRQARGAAAVPRHARVLVFCLEADGVKLQGGEGMGAAGGVDWRVTLRAPLQLENRLPCSAEYFVWEKPSSSAAQGAGSMVGASRSVARQHGVVGPGEAVHAYSIDIRCPVLLSWLPQGGWKQEKDAVLLWDPLTHEVPGGFWMTNVQNKRRLHVNLEVSGGHQSISADGAGRTSRRWTQAGSYLRLSLSLDMSSLRYEGTKVPRPSHPHPLHMHQRPLCMALRLAALTSSSPQCTCSHAPRYHDCVHPVLPMRVCVWLVPAGKVIRLQPHTVFSNHTGRPLHIRQADGNIVRTPGAC